MSEEMIEPATMDARADNLCVKCDKPRQPCALCHTDDGYMNHECDIDRWICPPCFNEVCRIDPQHPHETVQVCSECGARMVNTCARCDAPSTMHRCNLDRWYCDACFEQSHLTDPDPHLDPDLASAPTAPPMPDGVAWAVGFANDVIRRMFIILVFGVGSLIFGVIIGILFQNVIAMFVGFAVAIVFGAKPASDIANRK